MPQIAFDLRRPGPAWAFLSAFALAAVAACSSAATDGEVGAPCYPNGTCNSGLSCSAGKCVASKGGGGDATTSSTGTTGTTVTSGTTSGTGGTSGSGGSGATTSGTTVTGTTTSSSGGTGAPVFLDFGTNVTMITAGQSVTFTAVLTDSNGIASLVGGALTDQNGATYGAFQASGQMGSFQLTVSWDQMNQVSPIAFAYGGSEMLTFTAKFFDMNGKSAQMSTTITLTCNGLQAAAGVCYDTMNDAKNCGMPGHACGSSIVCHLGKCATLSACTAGVTTCNAMCTAAGKVCANECYDATDGAGSLGGIGFSALACAGTFVNVSCTTSFNVDKSGVCCCF